MTTTQPTVDREHVLALLEEAHSATTAQQLRQNVIGGLGALFESVHCAWTELNADLPAESTARTTVAESSYDQWDVVDMVALFQQYAWQHPILALVIETGHASAVSISELMSREEFTRLDMYTQFFTKFSVEDQLTVAYVENGYAKGLSINRATWGFTNDERHALTQIARCVFPHYRLLQRAEGLLTNELPLIEVTTNAFVLHSDTLGITPREAELLGEVARGQSNKQIASACGISEGTVRKHLENAFRRLGVSNRVSAITKSMRMIRRTIDDGPV